MKRRELFEEMNGGGMEEILGVSLRHKSNVGASNLCKYCMFSNLVH